MLLQSEENFFCDGEFINDLMLETAPFLFGEFANKDKINNGKKPHQAIH